MLQLITPSSRGDRRCRFWCLFLLGLVIALLPAARLGAQTGGADLREDLVADLVRLQDKWVSLAEAIAWDQYGWSPMEGTRTVADVFMHISAANIMIPNVFAAYSPTADLPEALRGLEAGVVPKIPESKAGVIVALNAGFDNMRAWIGGLSEEDLVADRDFFGAPTTTRTLAVFAVSHAHEHLGQQIAYARSNGVVPPWGAGGE